MRYRNRIVVVTGVGRAGQMGELLAEAFGREGATVIAADRDGAELDARVSELAARGLAVSGVSCDLTDPADAERLAEAVEGHGGTLQALVNAAGGFAPSGSVADSDPAIWERMRRINFETAYLATRALLPHLRRAEGAICYFAAAATLPGARSAGLSAYTAAKAAVVALMHAVAQEERKHGVRANCVAPTAIRTATNLKAMGEEPRYVEREEVAAHVLHLCAPESRSITGQVIQIG